MELGLLKSYVVWPLGSKSILADYIWTLWDWLLTLDLRACGIGAAHPEPQVLRDGRPKGSMQLHGVYIYIYSYIYRP